MARPNKAAKPPNNPMIIKATGVYRYAQGLYLQVRPGEDGPRRTWIFRYRMGTKSDGKPADRWMGLGPAEIVGLAEAKEACLAARRSILAGHDPIDTRKASRAKVTLNTFRQVAEAYIAAHETAWKNEKHKWQWRQTLEAHAYPVIGDMAVASVDTAAVTRILEPIWREIPETASRLRGRIEAILDFAKAREWRAGENPARWRGHLETLMPAKSKVAKVEHHAALPWRDIGTFMASVSREGGNAALALRFTILCGVRTNETIGATWGEIVLSGPEGAVWTIGPERMKAAKEHRVPLSPDAVAILTEAAKLRTRDDPGEFVFPGQRTGKGLSNMGMMMLLRRMGRDDLTVHGFRSTFRDWIAEATAYPRELAESALAHALKGTEAAYQRGPMLDKRRGMMNAWAAFCAQPMATEGAAEASGAAMPSAA